MSAASNTHNKVDDGVLRISQAAPVGSVDDEDDEREGVAQDELSNASKDHSNATDKVVGASEVDKTGWRDRALELTQDEDGRGVGDQETHQPEERGVSEPLLEVEVLGSLGSLGREEHALILLAGQGDRDLPGECGAVGMVLLLVLGLVVDWGLHLLEGSRGDCLGRVDERGWRAVEMARGSLQAKDGRG